MQYTLPELSEDCLYLNVYTPAEATRTDRLPVGEGDSPYVLGCTQLLLANIIQILFQ